MLTQNNTPRRKTSRLSQRANSRQLVYAVSSTLGLLAGVPFVPLDLVGEASLDGMC